MSASGAVAKHGLCQGRDQGTSECAHDMKANEPCRGHRVRGLPIDKFAAQWTCAERMSAKACQYDSERDSAQKFNKPNSDKNFDALQRVILILK